MSEYDAWAPVYDAWASDMTEHVAHYVSLAHEADGPIVELMVGRLLDVAGLEVEALYGGFEREPFTDESLEIVYVARRP
jgi:hypothetical protein